MNALSAAVPQQANRKWGFISENCFGSSLSSSALPEDPDDFLAEFLGGAPDPLQVSRLSSFCNTSAIGSSYNDH